MKVNKFTKKAIMQKIPKEIELIDIKGVCADTQNLKPIYYEITFKHRYIELYATGDIQQLDIQKEQAVIDLMNKRIKEYQELCAKKPVWKLHIEDIIESGIIKYRTQITEVVERIGWGGFGDILQRAVMENFEENKTEKTYADVYHHWIQDNLLEEFIDKKNRILKEMDKRKAN